MEVRIAYKEKVRSEDESVSDGKSAIQNDQQEKEKLDKDKSLMRQYQITEQQLSDLKGAFSKFDRGGTGFIAAHDLGNALRFIGQTPTEAELKDMLQEAVLDENGKLESDEFFRLVGSRGVQSAAEIQRDLEHALRSFDKDGRGFLDADELRSALQSYGEPLEDDDVTELMRMADVRRTGRIDYVDAVDETPSASSNQDGNEDNQDNDF